MFEDDTECRSGGRPYGERRLRPCLVVWLQLIVEFFLEGRMPNVRNSKKFRAFLNVFLPDMVAPAISEVIPASSYATNTLSGGLAPTARGTDDFRGWVPYAFSTCHSELEKRWRSLA
jgi:hypothetical protein